MRIDGFKQIKGFYSWVFANQDKRIKAHHTSLYMFFLNQNNRNNWAEWFKCPFDLAMTGAGINSKHTYYKSLNELQEWGLIGYKPGANEWKSPLIKLEILEVQKCTSTVPLCEPLPEPLVIPLVEPLQVRDINLLTNNFKLITDNLDKILFFLNEKDIKKIEDPDKPFDFDKPTDSERCIKATKLIADFFSVSETTSQSSFIKIGNFVRHLESKGKIDELADQFTAYRMLKEKDPQFKHNWKNYIGKPEEGYLDGKWCEIDWIKKERQPRVLSSRKLSYSIQERMEEGKKRREGITPQAGFNTIPDGDVESENNNEIFKELVEDENWIQTLSGKWDRRPKEVLGHLETFRINLEAKDQIQNSTSDAKKYFVNWVDKMSPVPRGERGREEFTGF